MLGMISPQPSSHAQLALSPQNHPSSRPLQAAGAGAAMRKSRSDPKFNHLRYKTRPLFIIIS